MYAVNEGEVANLIVVLVGESAIEVRVTLNTQDVSANGKIVLLLNSYMCKGSLACQTPGNFFQYLNMSVKCII